MGISALDRMTLLPSGTPWTIRAVQDTDNNLDPYSSGDYLFATSNGGLGLWTIAYGSVQRRTNLIPDGSGSWRLINTEALAMPR